MQAIQSSSLPTRHWRGLWSNNIASLEDLRKQYKNYGIVAIDIEGWTKDTTQASEIALSFLPPGGTDHSRQPEPPKSMHAFSANRVLKTHTISINGRSSVGRREYLNFGDLRFVDADQVEDALVEVLESFESIVAATSIAIPARPSYNTEYYRA